MLLERQKNLLALVEALGGSVARTDFQKLLFLWSASEQEGPGFDFVPYKFGALSLTSDADLWKLVQRELLADRDSQWCLTALGEQAVERAPRARARAMTFVDTAPAERGEPLVAKTYREYPFFAVKSEIKERVLRRDPAVLRRIEEETPRRGPPGLATIGYEGRSLETYLVLLLRDGVTLLCDVRRNPLSRRYGFSKSSLKGGCANMGIRYEHLPELGIASTRRKGLASEADYEALFDEYAREDLPRQPEALQTIARWVEAGERVALTCFEHLPGGCHRHCISDLLEERYGPALKAVHL